MGTTVIGRFPRRTQWGIGVSMLRLYIQVPAIDATWPPLIAGARSGSGRFRRTGRPAPCPGPSPGPRRPWPWGAEGRQAPPHRCHRWGGAWAGRPGLRRTLGPCAPQRGLWGAMPFRRWDRYVWGGGRAMLTSLSRSPRSVMHGAGAWGPTPTARTPPADESPGTEASEEDAGRGRCAGRGHSAPWRRPAH